MAIIGDALRQAFMPKHEYERLHEEEKAWGRLQRPLVTAIVVILWTAVIVSTFISVRIVFPGDDGNRPFCHGRERRIEELEANASSYSEAWDFSMTEDEVVGIYWVVVFFPSAIVFSASAIYLLAGIAVAYSAPSRHGCLKVVENNYCASRRGGAHCLSILNTIFAVVFSLLSFFLGLIIQLLGSSCSLPLFWCYEVTSLGLVILYGGTAFFLRRKAPLVLAEANFSDQEFGLEMCEAPHEVVTPDMEKCMNEGSKPPRL
ncbi:hypothetical protein MRB53_011825 [Persea americana]|uniref:Uncharacterized protein n=1 Tax=Persea americana TaxID=3435 RepID=A0ACC2LWG6_PERAE|nr:hypothetical protein MRB53_011825 [Persea americana]|eukprot:TRINITY_DN9425_c0_g1_i1.p1 TRINITY_DN9425_c0_g1~~TRINITY_DN9425_c0_g1_i1.p1  ORF type:complete len:260 (-),score=54.78 TRINITY_DN9425_c0_g1_i1:1043-1822(-)